jgi:hypothetical protein
MQSVQFRGRDFKNFSRRKRFVKKHGGPYAHESDRSILLLAALVMTLTTVMEGM